MSEMRRAISESASKIKACVPGSAIPVHMLLDAQDRLLCARSGGVSESDVERFRRARFP
jgi:hypothetical protein